MSMIATLGETGDLRATDILASYTNYGDNDECLEAVKSLGKIIDPRAVEPLYKVLGDVNRPTEVRKNAIFALGKSHDQRAIGSLVSALNDNNEIIQNAAASALIEFDNPQAKTALVAFRNKKKNYEEDEELEIYGFSETSLGNSLNLEVITEKYCVYCKFLKDPNLRDPAYRNGVGECSNYESNRDVVSLNQSCDEWMPNTKVRFWLSKGYMEHNHDRWPREPWYQVFDDGPDGERGTR